MKATDDPVVQARQLIADLRSDVAADLDALLGEMAQIFDGLAADVGARSREDLWREARRRMLLKFDTRLSGGHPDTDTLRQLVAEAHDVLTNPESRVDLKDWIRAAAPFVRS